MCRAMPHAGLRQPTSHSQSPPGVVARAATSRVCPRPVTTSRAYKRRRRSLALPTIASPRAGAIAAPHRICLLLLARQQAPNTVHHIITSTSPVRGLGRGGVSSPQPVTDLSRALPLSSRSLPRQFPPRNASCRFPGLSCHQTILLLRSSRFLGSVCAVAAKMRWVSAIRFGGDRSGLRVLAA
jgi:hypothetical protein